MHFQHDEDGEYGVNVRNNNGEEWVAYGDGRLFDTKSETNLRLVRDAVAQSVDAIWSAFCNPTYVNNCSTIGIDNVIPEVNPNKPNNFPLFSIRDKRVCRRKDVDDLSDEEVVFDWWGWSTVYLLRGYHPKNSRI